MRREKIKVSFSLKQALQAHEARAQHLEPSPKEREEKEKKNGSQSYPVFAAGVFEGAEDERAAAVVLHVVGQVLSGDVGCPALVRTLDGEARAVVLVVLQRTRQHRAALMRE